MKSENTSIFFTVSPEDTHACSAALARCEALAKSSRVNHIFFYFDGVLHANSDSHYHQWWQTFAQRFAVPLIVCSTLAETRGINQQNTSSFELAGLSEFYSRLHDCSTLVQI